MVIIFFSISDTVMLEDDFKQTCTGSYMRFYLRRKNTGVAHTWTKSNLVIVSIFE